MFDHNPATFITGKGVYVSSPSTGAGRIEVHRISYMASVPNGNELCELVRTLMRVHPEGGIHLHGVHP